MENVKCQSSKSKWQMKGFKPRARHDPLAWPAVRRLSRRIGGHRSAVCFGLLGYGLGTDRFGEQ